MVFHIVSDYFSLILIKMKSGGRIPRDRLLSSLCKRSHFKEGRVRERKSGSSITVNPFM